MAFFFFNLDTPITCTYRQHIKSHWRHVLIQESHFFPKIRVGNFSRFVVGCVCGDAERILRSRGAVRIHLRKWTVTCTLHTSFESHWGRVPAQVAPPDATWDATKTRDSSMILAGFSTILLRSSAILCLLFYDASFEIRVAVLRVRYISVTTRKRRGRRRRGSNEKRNQNAAACLRSNSNTSWTW